MDLLQGTGMSFEPYGRGDDAQTARLRDQVEKLQAQLKEREDAAKERIAKQDPQPIPPKSRPTSHNYASSDTLFKESPANNALLKKYSAGIAPTRTYTLKLSHHELDIIKALLEIRKSIEPTPFIDSMLEQITVQQRTAGY